MSDLVDVVNRSWRGIFEVSGVLEPELECIVEACRVCSVFTMNGDVKAVWD